MGEGMGAVQLPSSPGLVLGLLWAGGQPTAQPGPLGSSVLSPRD